MGILTKLVFFNIFNEVPVFEIMNSLLEISFSLPLTDSLLIFSVVLFVILAAPMVLRKFNIPSLVGLILAGLALGPHGLHVLNLDSSIRLFGKVGLLYIMFLAGLDLDMDEFRLQRWRSVGFGLLSFGFPMLLGYPVFRYILEFSPLQSLLIASLISTHTLVSYPLASRLGVGKNPVVAVAVGGTILTDTVVLLILAAIMRSVHGTLNHTFWIRLGVSVGLFFTAVLGLVPSGARWFFQKVQEDAPMQYLFVLGLVFLSGLLAELAGMDAIIGAFMAGLALNRLIPSSSALMNRIDFVGNTLFIPFFLLEVGMMVHLNAFLKGWTVLILAVVLLAVALSGKWLAAWVSQLGFGYSRSQRQLLFGLSSSRAAATLAVILVAYNASIVSDTVLNATIILILVTCLLSSFITERSARSLALENPQEAPPSRPVSRLLLPLANPANLIPMLDFAALLLPAVGAASLHAVHVIQEGSDAPELLRGSQDLLEKARKHLAASDRELQVASRIDLNTASGIHHQLQELGAEELILGYQTRRGPIGRLFGTTGSSLIQRYWNTIYCCRFVEPLVLTKRMWLFWPGYSEQELGFELLLERFAHLALQLGASQHHACSDGTFRRIKDWYAAHGPMAQQHWVPANTAVDFLACARSLSRHDMAILVQARKATLSYDPQTDAAMERIAKLLEEQSLLMVFPKQFEGGQEALAFQAPDLSLSPLQERMLRLGAWGKRLGKHLGRIRNS